MYTFRPLKEDDIDYILIWNEGRDASFLKQWAGERFHYPLTKEQILEDVKECIAVYMVYEDDSPIGTITIMHLDEEKGSAHIGRYLLSPTETGKGRGTIIMHDFLQYVFGVLKLKEVTLRVYTFNKTAIKCYEKNGFVVTKQNKMENDWDCLAMSCKKGK